MTLTLIREITNLSELLLCPKYCCKAIYSLTIVFQMQICFVDWEIEENESLFFWVRYSTKQIYY